MSNILRRVSLGTDFTAAEKREALKASPLCVVCKVEKSTQVDHPHALMWGGQSQRGLAMCGKCHHEKSEQENYLDANGSAKEILAHIEFWVSFATTPTGKRRTVRKTTVAKNASFAKRIHRAKKKARAAREAGDFEKEKHYHKLAAQIRREARGSK